MQSPVKAKDPFHSLKDIDLSEFLLQLSKWSFMEFKCTVFWAIFFLNSTENIPLFTLCTFDSKPAINNEHLHLHLCGTASSSGLGCGFHPASLSLLCLPKTNTLTPCFVLWTRLHRYTCAPQRNILLPRSSYPHLIFSAWAALDFANLLHFTSLLLFSLFLLLLLQQIPCFFHLFTHCCLKVLRKRYITYYSTSQCMHYGYGQIQQTFGDLIRRTEISDHSQCWLNGSIYHVHGYWD